MNVEQSWRMGSIAPLATAQHFSLFTIHYSLPAGTLFTSRRDHFSLFTLHFSLPEGTLFTSRRDHFSLFTLHFSLK